MVRWIKIYPKIFSSDECAGLIEYFEAAKDHWVETKTLGHRQFWELNLMDHTGQSNMNLSIYDKFKDIVERYKIDTKLHPKQWPVKYAWEALRLKKYESNIGNFLDHVDVGSYGSARRFLVLFIYLNDVKKGGETEFVNLDLQVAPECGNILVFPATWEYLHRGNVPVDQEKYILGSYLHYV
jgi:hypothetical protein